MTAEFYSLLWTLYPDRQDDAIFNRAMFHYFGLDKPFVNPRENLIALNNACDKLKSQIAELPHEGVNN